MPYIKQRDKYRLRHQDSTPCSAGELNFLITELCNEFIDTKNYAKLNEVIGVLECAKLEFYRRIVAPYEDKKIEQNGDVYSS